MYLYTKLDAKGQKSKLVFAACACVAGVLMHRALINEASGRRANFKGNWPISGIEVFCRSEAKLVYVKSL